MIINHNNLHLEPVVFKQDYQNFKKGMYGLLTASMQLDTLEFVCAINFHPYFGLKPPWISFFFTTEKDYKDFCENTLKLLSDEHIFWQEITDGANELKKVLKEHKNKT